VKTVIERLEEMALCAEKKDSSVLSRKKNFTLPQSSTPLSPLYNFLT
jgi:hypothetical protein